MKVRRHPDAAWRNIDGQAVIVTPDDGELHLLNETASFIWMMLESEMTEEEISAAICEEFEVERAACIEDAREFLRDLIARKIVEEV